MRVLLVGDTHGNTSWWLRRVIPTALEQKASLIVQVGDFGYWPKSGRFIDAVSESPLPVLFLDGNHEHHPSLQAAVARTRALLQLNPWVPVPLQGSLVYLPRGARLLWDGVRVAALGGGHSIDRRLRQRGRDWFPEEAVTPADLTTLASEGSTDILLTHDAPLCAPVPLSPRGLLPASWQLELPASDAHRAVLDQALDSVTPTLLVHGHYHQYWEGHVQRLWGTCQVVGLAPDDSGSGHFAVLDCNDGKYSLTTVAGTAARF
jgi:hypothetical protein